jgi:hypothetical protein
MDDQLITQAATHRTHDKLERQTSMPSVEFETAIPAIELPQTYVSDRTAAGSSFPVHILFLLQENRCLLICYVFFSSNHLHYSSFPVTVGTSSTHATWRCDTSHNCSQQTSNFGPFQFCSIANRAKSKRLRTGAQDSHLQGVTIPKAAHIQLGRGPPDDEEG